MKFTKTKTCASMDGQLYEVRVAALLFLRCKTSATISQFQLATNAAVGGQKLDDVVLRYKTVDEPDIWHTCFLQLKKKAKKILTDAALTGNSSDFALKNYLKSYLSIKEAMSFDDKEELLNGSFEDCQFILYTNANVGESLRKRTERGSLGKIETLLRSESKYATVLGFEEGKDGDIFATFETDNGKEFIRKMKVFTGQPTPDQLVDLIKKELRLGDSVLDQYSDTLYESYEKCVREWWENSDELLDEKCDFYDRALDKVRTVHANILSSREKSQACLDVRFKALKLFDDHFDSESRSVALLHVIAPETSQKLSCTKLLQFLGPDSFTFFRLKCLQQELHRVLPVWKLKENPPWLVILSKPLEDCKELGDMICEILQGNPDKRIAIVSQEFDQFTSYIKMNLDNNYKQLEDDSKASQLEEEAIVKLTEINVSFQGCLVDFKSVCNKNDTLLEDIMLDDSIMDSFINNKTHVVGCALSGDPNFYIPRTLLSTTVLLNDGKGSIAASGVSPQETQQTNPSGVTARIISDGHLEVCSTLKFSHTNRELRMLSEEVGGTHWIHKCNIDDCLDLKERGVLLVGEPGMGKTTIASHLARHTKKAHPYFWVICINLIEHKNLLKQASLCESPVEFLSSVLGLAGSPFEMSLLRLSVERAGNVVVILDGFDEISPEYETEGCRLIAGLLKTKVKKLWVTSRYFIKERVEKEMSVFAKKLQEFSTENQVDFLTKFWKEKHGCSHLPDVELKELIDKLLAKVSESLNDTERLFTGIPLQTMMLAEVFSDYAANPTEHPLPQKLNLLYLFEEFVEKKFIIYIRKLWPDLELNNFILNDMRTIFNQKHINASLVYLLPPEWLEKLNSKDEIIRLAEQFIKDVESGDDKTGIVDSVAHKRPKFIHRCFAEFFAAKFFFINYKQNKEFLRDHMFNALLQVVYQIFNNLLTHQLPLHTAVLCNDVGQAKQLLQQTNVNCIDDGGRSPLHLAVGYNSTGKNASFDDVTGASNFELINNESVDRKHLLMINLLLDNGADVNIIDYVLQWTPLQYAIQAENWDVAEILLTKNANPNEFFFPGPADKKSNYTLWSSIINDGHTSLMKCIVDQGLFAGDHSGNFYVVQRAITKGHLGLVKLLVANSEDILLPRLEGRTLIHQAARCGQTEILNFLIGILKRDVGDFRCAEGINLQDGAGYTAMYLACVNGFLNIVRLLSESGGDLKLLNKYREHLLLIASSRGFFDVVKFVIDSMDNDSVLIKACLNAVDLMEMTSLISASFSGHSDILRYLVEKGADVTGCGPHGLTALHIAVGNTKLSDVKLIIESLGEDRDSIARLINARLADGVTCVHWVSVPFQYPTLPPTKSFLADQVEIAKYLVSRGGNVRSVAVNGHTPLHCAAQNYAHLPTMKVFVESLGDDRDAIVSYINTRNLYGRTAQDCVRDNDFYLWLPTREERMEVVNWFDQVLEINSNVGC